MHLNAQDRCDRCGARACEVTVHEAGLLLWCAHHYREFFPTEASKEVRPLAR